MRPRSAPWFKVWPADFLLATLGWSLEQRGALLTLMCAAWSDTEHPCTLPDDARILAQLCGISVQRWRSLAPVVLRPFDRVEGRLRHPALWDAWVEMGQTRRRLSESGSRGAAKRWRLPDDGPANGVANGVAKGAANGDSMAG